MDLNVTTENTDITPGHIALHTSTVSYITVKSVSTSFQPDYTVAIENSTNAQENITSFFPISTNDSSQENITSFFPISTSDPNVMDYDRLLRSENSYEAKALTPVTIYLVMLMIIGVIGNTIVFYVYKFRFRRSTSRIFILSLAVFDLITCLLGMPFHIMDMLYPYMFVWDAACKVLSFALTFTILVSIFTLNLIAIDRYRKICKPFEKQLSGMGSKALSWLMVVIALISAIPMLFVYGSADVPTRMENVTGKECYTADDYIDSWFPLIYNSFIFLIFIVSVFILVSLYSKVGVTVWKRRKFTESSNGSKRSVSSQSTPSTSVLHLNVISDDIKLGTVKAQFNKDKEEAVVHVIDSNSSVLGPTDSTSPYKPTTTTSGLKKDRVVYKKKLLRIMSEASSGEHDSSTVELGSTLTRSPVPKRHHFTKKQKRTMRITAMLFVITVIFIISFLPYLIISVLDAVDVEFWNDMPIGELVIFNLLMRTYFINNMINPIIYWFLDHKFKEEVARLFKDIRKCKGSKFGRHQKGFDS